MMFGIRERISSLLSLLIGLDKLNSMACPYRGQCEKYDPVRGRVCHDVRVYAHLCPGYALFSRVRH